jgi:hypothetical protein
MHPFCIRPAPPHSLRHTAAPSARRAPPAEPMHLHALEHSAWPPVVKPTPHWKPRGDESLGWGGRCCAGPSAAALRAGASPAAGRTAARRHLPRSPAHAKRRCGITCGAAGGSRRAGAGRGRFKSGRGAPRRRPGAYLGGKRDVPAGRAGAVLSLWGQGAFACLRRALAAARMGPRVRVRGRRALARSGALRRALPLSRAACR